MLRGCGSKEDGNILEIICRQTAGKKNEISAKAVYPDEK